MAASKTSKGQEGYYARYKSGGVHAKNRKIKLARQLKLQPENVQVQNAIKDINYRRKTPGANTWSHSGIALAKVFKEFCGHFDKNILSTNPKMAGEALQKLPTNKADFSLPSKVLASISNRHMFSLMARMKTQGEYVHPHSPTLHI